MRNFFYRLVFFMGWVLSPFTFWNDAFVNIPISYLCASLVIRLAPVKFLLLVLIFYWLSNGLGLVMMYISGKHIVEAGKGRREGISKLILTVIIYSTVLILLDKLVVLKPIQNLFSKN